MVITSLRHVFGCLHVQTKNTNSTAARRQREVERRKQAICQAAWKCFLEKGISGTTMEEIAASCELAKGTVYLYFSGKDEIAFALLLRATEELLYSLQSALNSTLPAIEQIERLAIAYYEFFTEQPEAFRFMFVVPHDIYSGKISEDLLTKWAEAGKSALGILAGLLRQAAQEGEIEIGDPWTTAVMLWSAMTGAIVIPSQKVREPFLGDLDLKLLVQMTIRTLLNGLRRS
jgi:AcrR family transcriptional regulator